jgi:GNAT superfamily N-acetyltransferase
MNIPIWHEEPVSRTHNRRGFDCGQLILNDFLVKYSRQAHESGAAKTYVAIDEKDRTTVLGFYTLSPAHVEFYHAPEQARPLGSGKHPIGGFRLARLAVNKAYQGQGLGGELLVSAARRCIQVSSQVGGSLLLIDAKDQKAADWYKLYGALEIPRTPLSLVLPYAVIIEAMQRLGKPIL